MKLLNNVLFGGLALAAVAFLLMGSRGDLAGQDARALVANGAVLLDVRTPQEFAAGHLPGAMNVPHTEITGTESALRQHKNADIVVYCHSGRRSAHAVTVLRNAGFTKVHDLGAMSNW